MPRPLPPRWDGKKREVTRRYMAQERKTQTGSTNRRADVPTSGNSARPPVVPISEVSAALALYAAAFFVVAELTLAWARHLPLLPFFFCGGGFAALIALVASRSYTPGWFGFDKMSREEARDQTARFLALLLMTKFISVVVAVSGGTASPFASLLFVPVFIGALYFGVEGSVAAGAAIFLLFVILGAWKPTAFVVQKGDVLQGIVFLWVSLFAGLVVRRLERAARTAQVRAKQQADRAARFEWFSDTSMMMEAMTELEPMLGAGLLRVDELVPCDTVAVFLREPDGPDFLLAQTLGIADTAVNLHRVPLADQNAIHEAEYEVPLFWSSDTNEDAAPDAGALASPVGIFAELDREARHIVVVPLRTFGDVFGVLYVGRHGEKGFSPAERADLVQMARRIVYPIQRVRLQALATTDALTGLANQRAFRRRLQTEVERAGRYRHSLALLIIDIDHFKNINDTFGHRSGDAVLAQMGRILSRACRGIDLAARYGGEELAIICPETLESEALRIAERVRRAVTEHEFVLTNGEYTRLTVSVGVATLPRNAGDAPSLVEAADVGMYQAKQGGRNRVCLVRSSGPARPGTVVSAR